MRLYEIENSTKKEIMYKKRCEKIMYKKSFICYGGHEARALFETYVGGDIKISLYAKGASPYLRMKNGAITTIYYIKQNRAFVYRHSMHLILMLDDDIKKIMSEVISQLFHS